MTGEGGDEGGGGCKAGARWAGARARLISACLLGPPRDYRSVSKLRGKHFGQVIPQGVPELKLSGISPARIKKAGYSEAEVKDMMIAPRLASSVTGFTPQVV